MRNAFLNAVLRKGPHEIPAGCGMSLHPGYYSGRGAIRDDIKPHYLERIYEAIKVNVNEKAAKAFARMVRDIPVLSATDFLITLERLEANDWKWHKRLLSSAKGIYYDNMAEAEATIKHVLAFGDSTRDETVAIRAMFLQDHKLKDPRNREVVLFGPEGRRTIRCRPFSW